MKRCQRWLVVVAALVSACGGSNSRKASPMTTSPTLLGPVAPSSSDSSSSSTLASMSVGFDSGHAIQLVAFPPRNEPFAFRQQLESVYRDVLRRSPISTYVDIEGTIVWTQEYLRYRLSGCAHAESVTLVLNLIDGRPPVPDCGGTVAFPPRNEPFAFRSVSLEGKYRDGLGRPAVQTFVDIEGDIVWTTEYLRYRVGACDHATSTQFVINQINGSTPAPACQTWSLTGIVSDATSGARVSASVTATDSRSNTRSTATDGNGFFFLGPVVPGFVTVRATATGYDVAVRTLTLSADQRLDITMLRTAPPFSRSGVGNTVFDMPRTVSRVRIQGQWNRTSNSNFIVRVGGQLLVNEILRDSITYDGIHLTTGGVVEIISSSNISWTFTDVSPGR